MTNVDMANEIFRNVGKEYGYENVSVDWTAFKMFKVQWQRSYNWIAFKVSDYVKDAPKNIMEDLADSLFAKIAGKDGQYSEDFQAWVLAPEFSQSKRGTFIKRGRFLTENGEGEQKDLMESVDRLVQARFIPANHNIKVVWNKDTRSDMASTYSVLMRTVMVNHLLDDADVPDYVLDYVVYHQYLRIKEGTRTFGTGEEPNNTREEEKFFDGYEKAEEELDKFCLVLN